MNATETPQHKAKLLLLDDERLILATLGGGLRQAGFVVLTAETVDEAEAILASGERPDLAILDVNLPGQSGLAFAQRLREFDHVPFIMLSAYSERQYVDQATQEGALGYMVKPVDVVQLVPEVLAALARASDMQGLRSIRTQLQLALDNERDISVAVGLLMGRHNKGRRDAFDLLRQTARSQRRRLADLANDLLVEFDLERQRN